MTDLKDGLKDLQNLQKLFLPLVDKLGKQINVAQNQLTKEEKEKVSRFEQRLAKCVENNDLAGIMNLQKNFK